LLPLGKMRGVRACLWGAFRSPPPPAFFLIFIFPAQNRRSPHAFFKVAQIRRPVWLCPDPQRIYTRRSSARNHYGVDDTSVVQCLWLLEMRGPNLLHRGFKPPYGRGEDLGSIAWEQTKSKNCMYI
jgi:hypothetical protein